MQHTILVADDQTHILSAIKILLQSEGYEVVTATSPSEAEAIFKKENISLALIDFNYSLDTTSGEEGIALINNLRKSDELTPIIVMTGWGTIELAVDAIKLGANDFIQKPWENDHLVSLLRNQIRLAEAKNESRRLSEHNHLLNNEIAPDITIVSQSQAMKSCIETIMKVAKTDANILLTGNNGTGKSMIARFVHQHSTRLNMPFVTVNMGSVTESLFESEMFGHVKGAFTDAKNSRIGRFELAHQGTIFLDEIANTPVSQQAKLLRVLEERQFERIGSTKTSDVDFRLISATNSNLSDSVEKGLFRKDLLYRLNTVEINVPDLKDRVDDILPLAQYFLSRYALKYLGSLVSIEQNAMRALLAYSWPGNVRELSHVMERASILCQGSVSQDDLRLDNIAADDTPINAPETVSRLASKTLSELEYDALTSRLEYFDNDANKAAESLGLSRSSFYRRIGKQKK